jgi:hypothetical protein
MTKPMQIEQAVEIMMHNHRYNLGKAEQKKYTDSEIEKARFVLSNHNRMQANAMQRLR